MGSDRPVVQRSRDARSLSALLIPIAVTVGCGDVVNASTTSDGGRLSDARTTRDVTPGADSSDGSAEDPTRPDGSTGCDAGTPSVACLAAAGPIYANGAITVDDANVYWVEEGQTRAQDVIMRVPRAGGAAVTLAHAPAGALASDGTTLYFTVPNLGDGGSVMQIPVSGGEPTALAAATYPNCLTIDETSVYWTDPAGTGSVVKVAKTGGAPTVLVPPNATVPDNTHGLAIVVDATQVYWIDRSLFQVNKNGGDPVTLVPEEGANFYDYTCRALVRTGNGLVASLVGGQTTEVVTIPLSGDAGATELATELPASILAASATSVFFVTLTDNAGSLDEVAIDGGSPHVLAMPPTPAFEDLVLASDGTLYWTTEFQVESLAP